MTCRSGWTSSSSSSPKGHELGVQDDDDEACELPNRTGGWDDESSDSDSGGSDFCEESQTDPNIRVQKTETRGRPKGTFGSHELRQRLKKMKNEDQSAPAMANPRPGTIEHAREKRKQLVATRKRGDVVDKGIPDSLSASSDSIPSRIGNKLQQCLYHTVARVQRNKLDISDSVVSFFLRNEVLTTSASAIGKFLGATRSYVQRTLISSACSILHTGGWLWGCMMSMLFSLYSGESPTYVPLVIILKLKYDETPSKVRVVETSERIYMSPDLKKSPVDFLTEEDQKEFEKLTSTGSAQSANHAKVLQTQFEIAMLLKSSQANEYFSVTGEVPTSLQVMDKTTGECIRACLWDTVQAWFSVFFADVTINKPCQNCQFAIFWALELKTISSMPSTIIRIFFL